jgi:hypothetical protein
LRLAEQGVEATGRSRFYAVVAVLFLLWLAFIPGINNLGQVLVIVALLALAVVGIEALRRQTAREFPPGPSGA